MKSTAISAKAITTTVITAAITTTTTLRRNRKERSGYDPYGHCRRRRSAPNGAKELAGLRLECSGLFVLAARAQCHAKPSHVAGRTTLRTAGSAGSIGCPRG